MSFSREWEQRYLENTHLAVWPWSDVVSLVRRHCGPLTSGAILELGCGAGANIPFLNSLGARYYAIDGSPTMVARLKERFPALAPAILVGDFTRALPFATRFDLVIDRAALTHNPTADIRAALELVWEALQPGGYFVGVDWFSTGFSEFARGVSAEDAHTRTGYSDGPFAGTGRVHFSDLAHLKDLFGRFQLLLLEEKKICTHVPAGAAQFAAWNLVARKPHD
jgi:SAM-dependent methyltransferase